MKKTLLCISLIAGIASAQDTAQSAHRRAGTVAFPFLSSRYDARSLAMGGASAALPNGVDGLLVNPASMAYVNKSEGGISYQRLILDVRSTVAAGGHAIRSKTDPKPIGVICGYLHYLSYGKFDDLRNEQGQVIPGSLSPFDMAVGVSWASILWRQFAVGATIKGAYQNLPASQSVTYTQKGLLFDCGAQYRLINGNVILGMSIRNLGVVVSGFTTEYDSTIVPLSAVFGVSYVPSTTPQLRFTCDAEKPVDSYLGFNAGIEWDIVPNYVTARGGYSFDTRDVGHAIDVLRGESDDSYQKPDWRTGSLGLGVHIPIDQSNFFVDVALPFKTGGLPIGPALSMRAVF